MHIVVKIGTNLLTKPDYSLNLEFIQNISRQIIELIANGLKVILVSSGAMASGRSELVLKKESKNIPLKQALCAVGQGILINTYRQFFKPQNIPIAQILLTNLDFTNKKSFLTTRNTLNLLLELGSLPVINENDVTSFDEIKCGDNDMLSAKVASMISANLLIILTDVEGLFDANPLINPTAKLIPHVSEFNSEIKKMAAEKVSSRSLGGMKTKIQAAEYAVQSGVPVVITNGHQENILTSLILGKKQFGTYFETKKTPHESKKKWMQPLIKKNCHVIVDPGAADALLNKGKSLLPAGIIGLKGNFARGDIIKILDQNAQEIAYGIINYPSQDLEKIKGLHSSKIAEKAKFLYEPEVIHRDSMILL